MDLHHDDNRVFNCGPLSKAYEPERSGRLDRRKVRTSKLRRVICKSKSAQNSVHVIHHWTVFYRGANVAVHDSKVSKHRSVAFHILAACINIRLQHSTFPCMYIC